MILLSALSDAPGLSSAPVSRAMPMKRCDSARSSAEEGAFARGVIIMRT
jgi:hypothetical protein